MSRFKIIGCSSEFEKKLKLTKDSGHNRDSSQDKMAILQECENANQMCDSYVAVYTFIPFETTNKQLKQANIYKYKSPITQILSLCLGLRRMLFLPHWVKTKNLGMD